ncbi:proprotein convertase P-domain-containing protein [Flavilitoribacter nigricans]|nr:proprotein convertase P-domain-containing protein [Flavilitoribacter nigricans]
MNDPMIMDCSGIFFDGGGTGTPYSDSDVLTTTICSNGNTGSHVRLSFSDFEIATGDSLFFYDATTADPDSLLGTLNTFGKSGNNFITGQGFSVQATTANASGCLTLVFQPNNDGLVGSGWEATLSCGSACQNIFVELDSTDPAVMPADTGYIDLCPGETVMLSAVGDYPQSGIRYVQNDGLTSFRWMMDDGTTLDGQQISHVYDQPGGYVVQLVATDQNGCKNLNLLTQRVRVAPPPSFNTDIQYPICIGDTVSLTASNQPADNADVLIRPGVSGFPISGVRADSLPLPDGLEPYTASLVIKEFPADAVIETPEDLESICLNIEHSYLFDLDIIITCPNGQSDTLQQTSLLSGDISVLGEPYEADDTLNTGSNGHIPGIGYDYCFTSGAPLTWNEYINVNGHGQLPAGDYRPVQGFEQLIGCPLNGEWTLQVTDEIVDDNGWIFEWAVNFANRLLPFANSFSPAIVDYSWVNNPEVDFFSSDSIATYSGTAGDISYLLNATDEFGCSWDTSVVVTVLPETHPDCYECTQLLNRENDVLICNPESRQLDVTNNELVLDQPVSYIATPNVPVGFDNAPPGMPLQSVITAGNVVPSVLSDPASQILSVCVDLSTDRLGDIELYLQAPSGQRLELSTKNGGNSADGYSQVCFTPGAATAIDFAFPPYAGDYLPEGDFSDLTGAAIDGDWTLLVSDDANINESGVLKSWSISFQSTNEITYSWSPAFGLDCDECPNPMAAPSATTNYVVRATDLFGCTDRDTIVVAIASDLPEPQIGCEITSNGQITFNWQKVENFSLFDVRLTRNGNTAAWEGPITDLEYTINGLQLFDTVSLDLRVFADPNAPSCDNPEVRSTCVYASCVHEGQIEEVTPVSCSELSDGTISIMGVNGIEPYRYFIDDDTNGQDNGFFDGLSAGDHIVVIEDQTGCRDTTAFEVPAPLPLQASLEREKAVSCPDGDDGILRAMVSGGTMPYSYDWVGINRPDTGTVDGLAPGTYEVIITDQNNCTVSANFTLNNPTGMQITLEPVATSCFNTEDGAVVTSITGGTPDYTFLWDNGATVSEPNNFSPGQHCVTVTDGRGCQEVVCTTIEAPASLNIEETIIKPAECFDTNTGSATVVVSGGSGNYTYLWSDNLQQISQEAVRLRAGTYTVSITDDNSCEITTQVEVPEPGPLTATPSIDDALCFGSSDGAIRLEMSGGNAPFTFNWSNGGSQQEETGLSSGTYEVTVIDAKGCETAATATVGQPATAVTVAATQTDRGCAGTAENEVEALAEGGSGSGYTYSWNDANQQSGPVAIGLDANIYVVTAMDDRGCTGQDTIALTDLPEIEIGIIANSPSCSGIADGRMGVNQVEGGIGGDDPDNFDFMWNTGSSALTISGLAGDIEYSVTATDSRGCRGVQTRFLPQPDTISFDYVVTDVSCNQGSDGTIGVENIAGPNSGFTISWGVATGGQTGPMAERLPAGNYRVTITDSKGCRNFSSIRVNQPDPIAIQFQTVDISCFGGNEGSITAIATGGQPDYTYQWSNSLDPVASVSNLSAGDYTLTVTDTNNCESVATVEIDQPATVEVNLNITDVSCFGNRDGRIEITTNGGTPPYMYSLNNINYNGVSTVIGLEAGDRVVYVRDAKGCLYAQPVTVASPPEFQLDLGPDITINLGDTVDLNVALIDAAGGIADLFWSAPYSGTLSCEQCDMPAAFPQNSIIYSVTGYDGNGCEAEDQVRVRVEKPRVVLVPTGFSPNGDQANDRLIVHGLEGTTIKVFRIFDRWGQLLFEKYDFPVNDPAEGWDGTFRGEPLNSGVYIWYLEAIYPFDQVEESFKGQTTLIR